MSVSVRSKVDFTTYRAASITIMRLYPIAISSCYFVCVFLLRPAHADVKLNARNSGCQKFPFTAVNFREATSQIFGLMIGTERYIRPIQNEGMLASRPRAKKPLDAVITRITKKQYEATRRIRITLLKLQRDTIENHVQLYCGEPPVAVWKNNWRKDSRDSVIEAQTAKPCAHPGILYETSKPLTQMKGIAPHPLWITICPSAMNLFQNRRRFSLAHPLLEIIPRVGKPETAVDLSRVSGPFNNIDLYAHKFYSLYLMGLHSILVPRSSIDMPHSSNLQESSADFAQALRVREAYDGLDDVVHISAVLNPFNFVQYCLRIFLGGYNTWDVDGVNAQPINSPARPQSQSVQYKRSSTQQGG